MDKLSIADLIEARWEENKKVAKERYDLGEHCSYSKGICGTITAGYGMLDEYGYWEFPLDVNQVTLEIV